MRRKTIKSALTGIMLLFLILFVSCGKKNQDSAPQTAREILAPQIAEAFEKEEWEKVVLLFDSLVNSNENFDDLLFPYSVALDKLGQTQMAIEKMQDILKNDIYTEKKHIILNALGDAYFHNEEYEKSFEAYQESLKLQPNYARPMVGLGELLVDVGDTINAVPYYANAASLFDEHKMVNELSSIADRMLQIAPNNSNTWQIMAKVYEYEGDYENEEKCLIKETALLFDGNDIITDQHKMRRFILNQIQFATVKYNQNKFDECLDAIKYIKESCRSLGDYEEDVNHLEKSALQKIANQ